MVLPIILRKLAAAFFASLLPIILRKNWLHHHLKAFETSTRITLEIFPQMILPYTNQIISSTHEQSDFWTSITCFPISSYLPFHFSLPFPYLFLFRFFLPLLHLIPCINHSWDKFYAIWSTPYTGYEGTPHNFQGVPTLDIPSPLHTKNKFLACNPKVCGME